MPPPLDPLACAVFVIVAFIPAGLVHSLWLRSPWAARWRIPIDRGLTWRGSPAVAGRNDLPAMTTGLFPAVPGAAARRTPFPRRTHAAIASAMAT